MIASPEFKSKYFNNNRQRRSKNTVWCSKPMFVDRLTVPRSNGFIMHYFIKKIETIIFPTNKLLFLQRFGYAEIFEYRRGNYERAFGNHPVRISISQGTDQTRFDETNSIVLCDGQTNFVTNVVNCITMFDLYKPIVLKPGFVYQIRTEQNLPANYCTIVSQESELEIAPDITIRFHCESTRPDGSTGGFFQRFVFYEI